MARSLTPRMANALGAHLGAIAYRLMPSRRRIAIDNLKHGMGDTLSDDQIERVAREVFRNTGRTLFEFARFSKCRLEGIRRVVVGAGLESMQKAHSDGRGAIVATAHFGNWEILGPWVAAQGFPVDILVAAQHNPRINRMITDFRKVMGVGIIELTSGVRGVFRALRANRFVAIGCDQHSPAGTVVLDFFGRPAAVARGPALFAARCSCPIIPMLLRRERHDRHAVIAGDLIYPLKSGNDERDILSMTRTVIGFFEENIRRYPDQWLWTHRRWKPQSGDSQIKPPR